MGQTQKLGVLIIGRKRPGFDQEWNGIMRARAEAAVRALGFDVVMPAPVVYDETVVAAIGEIRGGGAEALVVLQPSLGNGELAPAVTRQWAGPVVLWATPERPEGEKVSSCSLVAQHLWGSIFRQARHPFELVYGDPDDAAVREELRDAIALARTCAKMRSAKVGLIGSHAPGFLAMAADGATLRRDLGVQLINLSLPTFMERCRAMDESAVRDDVERVRAMKLPMGGGVSGDDLPMNSRYYLAMREITSQERLDALAIQCWPELPAEMGQWPYLAIVRLASEGAAIAMEGDVDAALTCLAAKGLGCGAGFITDWLEHDDTTITLWHPGVAPLQMCDPPTLAVHFNIAKPMVVDAPLRVKEPVTIARLWRCDDRYHATAFEGRTIPPRRKLTGNVGLVEVNGGGVRKLFDEMLHAGLPHHPVLFMGKHLQRFRKFARMMQIDWI